MLISYSLTFDMDGTLRDIIDTDFCSDQSSPAGVPLVLVPDGFGVTNHYSLNTGAMIRLTNFLLNLSRL